MLLDERLNHDLHGERFDPPERCREVRLQKLVHDVGVGSSLNDTYVRLDERKDEALVHDRCRLVLGLGQPVKQLKLRCKALQLHCEPAILAGVAQHAKNVIGSFGPVWNFGWKFGPKRREHLVRGRAEARARSAVVAALHAESGEKVDDARAVLGAEALCVGEQGEDLRHESHKVSTLSVSPVARKLEGKLLGEDLHHVVACHPDKNPKQSRFETRLHTKGVEKHSHATAAARAESTRGARWFQKPHPERDEKLSLDVLAREADEARQSNDHVAVARFEPRDKQVEQVLHGDGVLDELDRSSHVR